MLDAGRWIGASARNTRGLQNSYTFLVCKARGGKRKVRNTALFVNHKFRTPKRIGPCHPGTAGIPPQCRHARRLYKTQKIKLPNTRCIYTTLGFRKPKTKPHPYQPRSSHGWRLSRPRQGVIYPHAYPASAGQRPGSVPSGGEILPPGVSPRRRTRTEASPGCSVHRNLQQHAYMIEEYHGARGAIGLDRHPGEGEAN